MKVEYPYDYSDPDYTQKMWERNKNGRAGAGREQDHQSELDFSGAYSSSPATKSGRMGARRDTSLSARERLEAGDLNCQQDRVYKMWVWLTEEHYAPCSTKTAANVVTKCFNENIFSDSSANYDVIHKRTPELVTAGKIEEIEGKKDWDGVKRIWYKLKEIL